MDIFSLISESSGVTQPRNCTDWAATTVLIIQMTKCYLFLSYLIKQIHFYFP